MAADFPGIGWKGSKGSLGIPLPATTQCEIVAETAERIQPALHEFIRQAAQGEVLYNDDTFMRVLALRRGGEGEESGERTGVFTSGIVSTGEGRRMVLFFTGRKHAGENLGEVLKRRVAEGPDRGKESGAQLGSGRGDKLPAQALGPAYSISAPSGCPVGQ